MSSTQNAIDVDGDEFMRPAEAAAAVNKFARPTLKGADTGLFSFGQEKKHFDRQYYSIYMTRLNHLKPIVLDAARAALPKFAHLNVGGEAPTICTRVLDIRTDRHCVIAGTIYKEMKLKPCILEEYNKTTGASATTQAGQVYTSPDDSLVLEDEFGRVSLVGSPDVLDVRGLVSGLVVAVLGREGEGGKFEVAAVFIPEMAPQKPLPSPTSSAPAYLLCVSGLHFGAPGQDSTPIQLLMDYAAGLLGSTADQASAARIARVLVAGNSLHRFEKRKGVRDFARDETDTAEVGAALRELDMLLTQLAAAVPVDILPGEKDPSNFTLPQQAFHPCLFPSASTYSTFNRTTNPSWLEINKLQVLATAGQNINDLVKYSEAASNVDFLANCLKWRNVAPTAPDTLGCYPYQSKDPFVLTESPHVYVVGNQLSYETRLVRGPQGELTRVVSLPSFAETGTAVLVDLNSPTLDAQSITFKVQGGK